MKFSRRTTTKLWRKDADVSLRSDDGALEFRLSTAQGGLYVERIDEREPGARVVLSTLFRDGSSFARWCDADAVRFVYPVIYVNLKRHGDAVLQPR
jgi:hypothetical protein